MDYLFLSEWQVDQFIDSLNVPTMDRFDLPNEDDWEHRGLKAEDKHCKTFILDPDWRWICWRQFFYFKTEEDMLMFKMRCL